MAITSSERREVFKMNITTDTVTDGDYVIRIKGEYQVDIFGVFDSATINYYAFTSEGRGVSARTAATVGETFTSKIQNMEVGVGGGGGSLDIWVIATPIIS